MKLRASVAVPLFALCMVSSPLASAPVTPQEAKLLDETLRRVDTYGHHYSLNFDTEHGGEYAEPWRRMFMSDAATAFAALALLPSE